ncbi:MAG: hypothetical protein Q7J29_04525 [Stagnimonas sp.]|nr:hypothetical protein [Stagnimonas sp.]
MTLTEAIRAAAEQGCELVRVPGLARYTIRAIGYDADPFEISEDALLDLSREEFLLEWIPPHV